MKRIRGIAACAILLIFCLCNIAYPIENEKEIRTYIEEVNPILTNADATYRNINMKLFPLEEGAKRMQEYIDEMTSITAPEFMRKQHRMILLAFKKLRMVYYLLSSGDRDTSLPLAKRVGRLLKLAVKDIKAFLEKEGLVKANIDAEGNKERGAE